MDKSGRQEGWVGPVDTVLRRVALTVAAAAALPQFDEAGASAAAVALHAQQTGLRIGAWERGCYEAAHVWLQAAQEGVYSGSICALTSEVCSLLTVPVPQSMTA